MTAGRIAFGLLTVGFTIQLITILWGGAAYPDYDHARQYISELGATGALTGPAVSWWGFVPSGLLIGGGCLIDAWLSRRNVLAIAAWLGLAWYGLTLAAAGVYPCEFECSRAEPSMNALMHDLYGGTGYLAGIVALPLVALVARSQGRRKLAVLAVVCTGLAVVGFGGVVAEAQPGGLIQRMLEGAIAVVLLTFAWTLTSRPVIPAVARS